MHAWTTCAVIAFSMGAPEEPVEPLRFMPSHREFQRRDAAEDLELQQQLSDFHIRAGIRAIELKNNAK